MVSYSIFLSQKVNISKQKEALKYPALIVPDGSVSVPSYGFSDESRVECLSLSKYYCFFNNWKRELGC